MIISLSFVQKFERFQHQPQEDKFSHLVSCQTAVDKRASYVLC